MSAMSRAAISPTSVRAINVNTPTTPLHANLWNRDFWFLVTAELLLNMAVYMLVPTMPQWLLHAKHLTAVETGMAMGAFGVGLYVLGLLCSWLVQRYRRNQVCMWAIGLMTLTIAMLWYADTLPAALVGPWAIVGQRLLMGATFGLAQMVLASTLIIDTCESGHRTVANYNASWFARFAMALGPLAGLLASTWHSFHGVLTVAMGCCLTALLLVRLVSFPFRAPDDQVRVASFDRFLLPTGHLLFVNLLLVSTVGGLLLTMPLTTMFYAVMMCGFLLALLAQRFIFREAELKSEVVSGLILLVAALLTLLWHPQSYAAPLLTGTALGIIAARFLLFFVRLSRHCQRGTSQSMYFLGWESGIALGLCMGYTLFYKQPQPLLITALALTTAALLMYHLLTHIWIMQHKNR